MPIVIDENNFLSVEETCEKLECGERFVLNRIRSGELHAVRIGRNYRIAERDLLKLFPKPEPDLIIEKTEDKK